MSDNPQCVTVRIAVAVDRNGCWSAAGNCAYQSADEAVQAALDYLPQESAPPKTIVWVNATVPIPGIESVPGVVASVSTP
jgi:hypothetical protein